MQTFSHGHLTDQALDNGFIGMDDTVNANIAMLLSFMAEFDSRKRYVPAGYPTMTLYCFHVRGMSKDEARRRIRAAHTARQFPAIFPLLAENRLNLSAVSMLTPFLTEETAGDLLAAAADKTTDEIELLLAERFPKPDVPACVQLVDAQASFRQPSVARRSVATMPRAKVAPLSAERFAVQFTISKEAYDRLRHAEALLSHQVRPGDFAEVVDRAVRFFVSHLEKRKFGATDRPRQQRRASKNPRYIPAHVKRAVWERDGEQCTFVSDAGHRCEARANLQFDHIEEVARGGTATVSNIRLRCRAHNQYGAERTFGPGFMEQKRREAQRAAAERREKAETERLARAEARAAAAAEKRAKTEAEKRTKEEARAAEKAARAKAAEEARAAAAAAEQAAREAREKAYEIIPWLRRLGFRAEEAKHAAEQCESFVDAPMEERVRRALSMLAPTTRRDASHLGAP